jgi:hypothetical protein
MCSFADVVCRLEVYLSADPIVNINNKTQFSLFNVTGVNLLFINLVFIAICSLICVH